MKIAYIGQKGIPSRAGGVEIHVEEIAKYMAKDNDVTVYCRRNYCSQYFKEYKGIHIKYINSINSKHLDAITYTFLATIDAIKQKNQIIHYHALGPSLLSFIPKLFGIKVISTCHGLDWKRDKWNKIAKKVLKLGEYASVKFPDKTIAVSNSISCYLKEKYKKDIIYIPNGIDKKVCREVDEIRNKYNLDKNGYILFLARLVPEKGAHYLIDAFNKCKTNKKLVIVGGSSHSDDYVECLHGKAKDNKNIIFTGFLSGEILDELYYNAYLYVLPSEIEGLPISLLEAMAYGQCCLVSNIKENLEVIEDKAIAFKSKSVEDLQQKLQYLIDNTEIVNRYKSESKKYVLKKYNWDDVSKRTQNVYKLLIN